MVARKALEASRARPNVGQAGKSSDVGRMKARKIAVAGEAKITLEVRG
jgi:hypothetical protein